MREILAAIAVLAGFGFVGEIDYQAARGMECEARGQAFTYNPATDRCDKAKENRHGPSSQSN